MNIRRYMAPDMRTAFKLVRDELGPDVVILSTRRVKGQIEITVAADQSPVIPQESAAVKSISFASLGRDSNASTQVTSAERVMLGAQSVEQISLSRPAAAAATPRAAQPAAAAAAPTRVAPPAAAPSATPTVTSAELADIRAAATAAVDGELKALRRLLETQLAALAWNDLSRRTPAVAETLRELTELGYSRDLATEVTQSIPESTELATARLEATRAIESRIKVTGDRWAEEGGVLTVVGPSGAGKTTALAALAARWVMRNGTRGAALISAGESRFGVRENLLRVGRLVGIPVYVLGSFNELPALLERIGEQRMVLIDTAGCSPRSANFEQHLETLRKTLPDSKFALALSASTQAGTIREIVSGYRTLGSMSCVITHIDESTTLGGLLSAIIDSGLPVSYTLDGQRLLDDLRPARAEMLVELAATLAKQHGAAADDELLARRLEGRTHVA